MAESTLFSRGRSGERHGKRVVAQGMVIGLLLVMAAVAGAVCVWLLIRGLSRTAAARSGPTTLAARDLPRVAAVGVGPSDPVPRIVAPLESQTLTSEQTFHTMYDVAFGALAHQGPPQQELRLVAESAISSSTGWPPIRST